MNDEIREILNNVEINELKHNKWYCSVEKDNMQKILDCITNLERENQKLKEELQQEKKDFKEANDYCFELKNYKSKVEKAVEKSQELKDSIDKSNFDGMTKTILILGINQIQNILQNGSENNE